MSAVTAVFIFNGYRGFSHEMPPDEAAIATGCVDEDFCGGGGEVAVVRRIAKLAVEVDAAVAPLLAADNGPGVWYYDVAEPLGERLAHAVCAGVVLSDDDIVRLAVVLTHEWLVGPEERY